MEKLQYLTLMSRVVESCAVDAEVVQRVVLAPTIIIPNAPSTTLEQMGQRHIQQCVAVSGACDGMKVAIGTRTNEEIGVQINNLLMAIADFSTICAIAGQTSAQLKVTSREPWDALYTAALSSLVSVSKLVCRTEEGRWATTCSDVLVATDIHISPEVE